MMKWFSRIVAPALLVLAVFVIDSPWALAFPYHAQFDQTVVYSETPIGPRMASELARAESLLAQSPLYQPHASRRIYLTQGGWRWHVLALQSVGAFGFRRPFGQSIVLNRSDIASDHIYNNASDGGVRTLSGVIAHESTHLMVARAIGEIQASLLPVWKREGYPDYVAQESSLSDADAARVLASGAHPPALAYYNYRKQVAAALQENGGNVRQLLQ